MALSAETVVNFRARFLHALGLAKIVENDAGNLNSAYDGLACVCYAKMGPGENIR